MAARAQPRPTLVRERALWAETRLLIGVDEAGRGPLAGPVVAAAVILPQGCRALRGLRDSKTLPAPVRERLAAAIRARALAIGVGAASSREIDRLNIRVATAVAMRRAIDRARCRLIRSQEPSFGSPAAFSSRAVPLDSEAPPFSIIIDGLPMPEIGCAHEALVDGDAHCHSIAAAGIIAKTVRDVLMHRLARRYPVYGWQTNVGYGTAEHQAGLRAHGPTRHHRRSFAPVAQLGLGI